jgi:hypothetical protein
MKTCPSCAASVADGATFAHGSAVCSDCVSEAQAPLRDGLHGPRIRRAAYRAAVRRRQQSNQLDLVDLVAEGLR